MARNADTDNHDASVLTGVPRARNATGIRCAGSTTTNAGRSTGKAQHRYGASADHGAPVSPATPCLDARDHTSRARTVCGNDTCGYGAIGCTAT